jgi:hypothetical protein
MNDIAKIIEEIHAIAKGVFESNEIENFVSKVQFCLADESPIDYIFQVSTDEGNELELGFFTDTKIADVTLSKGKVYFYIYPVSTIQNISVTDAESKWTLTIIGEKKFDYNVVKPADNKALSKYERSLKVHLSLRKADMTYTGVSS